MSPVSYSDYLLLALLAGIWCVLHSWLISVSVTEYLKSALATQYRYYRLFFNAFSILTLAVVIWYRYDIRGEIVFDWTGYLRIVQFLMIVLGIVLFVQGAKKYDARRFLGLTQLKEDASLQGLTKSGELDTSGILQVIRHPWYASLLLIIWALPMDVAGLVLNSVFTVYLLIGAWLEEKKLLREFGDAYGNYQKSVSMLIPLKWLKSKLVN